MYAFGAQFAEAPVDEDLGSLRVSRMAGCFGARKILNPKTARSQFMGGDHLGHRPGVAGSEQLWFVSDASSIITFRSIWSRSMRTLRHRGVMGSRGRYPREPASKASAKSTLPAPQLPLPMRYTTRPASVCAIFRLRSIS